jgi:putative salt-induced outer membrane protein
MSGRLVLISFSVFFLFSSTARAQQPPPAPPTPRTWTTTATAGVALTNGNSDTSTVNAGYEVTYDPRRALLLKSDGLYLRGRRDGDLTADRIGLNGREEYRFNPRGYTFGQMQYLHDTFKQIQYLLAPTGGVGYRLIDSPVTRLSVDAGVGGVWEKNPGIDVRTSGAISGAEKLQHQLTPTTTLTVTATALFKMNNFDDALYTLDLTLAAAVNARIQLKLQFLNVYKNKVSPGLVKNDVAIVVGVAFKN